ncbi:hypothetical protein RB595_009958 [Gaeumannomyces hyphopodioides]
MPVPPSNGNVLTTASMPPSTLDAEIQRLKKQADQLKAEAKLHATALLSRPDAAQHLLVAQPTRRGAVVADGLALSAAQVDQLRDRRARQAAHDRRNTYRACAGVTAFRARDPDPAAVDGGSILGLRFEAMRSAGRFVRPFYVLLNRPWAASPTATTTTSQTSDENDQGRQLRRYLRVHRHTLPPAIPLAGLAARYLPPPPRTRSASGEAGKERRQQDLGAFVRHLRREVVRHHHRLGAVADMRAAAGVDQDPAAKGGSKINNHNDKNNGPDDDSQADRDGGGSRDSAATDGVASIVDIQPADTAAMQIRIEWRDGRVGRLVLGPNGEVRRCAVVGIDGARDRLAELDVAGGCATVEDVVAKLRRGAS